MKEEFLFSELNISTEDFRRKALRWAEKFNQVAYYSDNLIPYLYNGFENLLAVSDSEPQVVEPEKAFGFLQTISDSGKFWCGLLNYDLKNQVEKLSSKHQEHVGFPVVQFFEPEIHLTFQALSATVFSEKVAPEIALFCCRFLS